MEIDKDYACSVPGGKKMAMSAPLIRKLTRCATQILDFAIRSGAVFLSDAVILPFLSVLMTSIKKGERQSVENHS